MSDTLLVMSTALPGREKEYSDWYCNQHLADILRTPGVTSGAFYELSPIDRAARWGHAARYDLNQPVAKVVDEIYKRAGSPEMPSAKAINLDSVLMLGFTPYAPRAVRQSSKRPAIMLVMSTALDGQEEAYNTWYDKQHINDVLAVPGFVAAQRFKVAPNTGGKPSPWAYAVIYEIEADRMAESVAETNKRAGGPQMPVPQLFKPDVYIATFKQIA